MPKAVNLIFGLANRHIQRGVALGRSHQTVNELRVGLSRGRRIPIVGILGVGDQRAHVPLEELRERVERGRVKSVAAAQLGLDLAGFDPERGRQRGLIDAGRLAERGEASDESRSHGLIHGCAVS